MKSYPKIEYYNKGYFDKPVIAFDKLDGSNFRAEFSRNRKGFYKFGTRNVMIDKNTEFFGNCVSIFLEKYSDDLCKVFRDKYNKIENFVIFGEYLGDNSFAGQHELDDVMDVVLFDVNQYKRGFINPYEFVENFGHLHIPDIIYEGKYTNDLITDVRLDKYGLSEGVVCKGVISNKNNKEEIWTTKIKTNEWLNKVRLKFGEKYLLEELNNDKNLLI